MSVTSDHYHKQGTTNRRRPTGHNDAVHNSQNDGNDGNSARAISRDTDQISRLAQSKLPTDLDLSNYRAQGDQYTIVSSQHQQ